MEKKVSGNEKVANQYLQRLALLKDYERKVENKDIIGSIDREKFLLDNLVYKLMVQAKYGKHNVKMLKDEGVTIRCGEEEYHEIQQEISQLQEENRKYISIEDENDFKDKFRWDRLPAHYVGIGYGAKNIEEYIKNEIDALNVPADKYEQLQEIKHNAMDVLLAAKMKEKEDKQPEHIIEGGQMPIVKKSKFEQIYDKAKGKIKGMLSAIKNKLNAKDKEQDKEEVNENEIDER